MTTTAPAASSSTGTGVLLHAQRTADPRIVRWVVRGHLPGPCTEPVCHRRDGDPLPPFVERLVAAFDEVVAVTVRAEARDGGDVLTIDVGIADPARWRAMAADVQAMVRDAVALRWWPDGPIPVAVGLRTAGDPATSLPSGPCRSCPRSSSRTSTCGRPPGPPPAST